MPYIAGSPIVAHCPHCSKDTEAVVIEVEGIYVHVVRCNECSNENAYRPAQSKARKAQFKKEHEEPAPKPKRKRKATVTPEEVHQTLLQGRDTSNAREYNIRLELEVGEIIDHAKFGYGVVIELPAAQKAKIVFEDGERLLICGRQ